MPTEVSPPRLKSKKSPREIIAAHFESVGELPIRGGWGYTLEDAVVIDRNDPIVKKDVPFDGVGIEHVFVEKRIYEELIVARSQDDLYSGIRWNRLSQSLSNYNNRQIDILTFEVKALHDSDWERLKSEWEGPEGRSSPDFDIKAHLQERDECTIRYVTEYYFDVTSFFGR